MYYLLEDKTTMTCYVRQSSLINITIAVVWWSKYDDCLCLCVCCTDWTKAQLWVKCWRWHPRDQALCGPRVKEQRSKCTHACIQWSNGSPYTDSGQHQAEKTKAQCLPWIKVGFSITSWLMYLRLFTIRTERKKKMSVIIVAAASLWIMAGA